MNLQWSGNEPAARLVVTGVRPRPIVRQRDEMDRAVERMLADARGKCGVARGGRWSRDSGPIAGRDAGLALFGPGRAGVHTDVRHRRPCRVA